MNDFVIRIHVVLAAGLILIGLGHFVVPQASGQQTVLVVESNQNDAGVFADGEWIGYASRSPFGLPAGVRQITVSPPGLDAWSIEPIRVELSGSEEDTIRVDAVFPWHYKFESVPLNVTVIHEDEGRSLRLGVAPLLHISDEPLAGAFVFEKEGYHSIERPVQSQLWNRYLVELEPDSEALRSAPELALRRDDRRGRRWIDVASVTAAVAAGALAVHYRTKADNRYETWQETGDPALKNEIQRLDVYSGVALGTMQVGLGIFAFRLVF